MATKKALQARVEEVAEQISHPSQSAEASAGPTVVDVAPVLAATIPTGDVGGLVANVVNVAVNTTNDALNALANFIHNADNLEDLGDATLHIVNQVVAQTQIAHELGNVAQDLTVHLVQVVEDGVECNIGGPGCNPPPAASIEASLARAPSAQLIAARRALLRERNNAFAAQAAAKRSEIKDKIAAVRERLTRVSRRRVT